MKHYRLKKDLPTFKAGQTFHMSADGNLWLDEGQDGNHWQSEVMAYNHRTLERFPNILEDWFDEIVVPSPSYMLVTIQKLQNSVKALDERLKAIEGDAKPVTPVKPYQRSFCFEHNQDEPCGVCEKRGRAWELAEKVAKKAQAQFLEASKE